MTKQPTNYRLLRVSGRIITVFGLLAFAGVLANWIQDSFIVGPLRPMEPMWVVPLSGIAFGELCRAVADMADRQFRRE